ncbi:MAG: 2Fe-2S iron-sulfur cluster-binding protein [Bacteroidota bacterium]
MSIFHKLLVKEVTRETKDAISIVFDIPDGLKNEFLFTPGQYLTIQKELEGQELRRAYSICSSPKSDELRIAIKAIPKGLFSVFANSKLKKGDSLKVSAPEGKFVLQISASNANNYIAFASGSGITPILSMVQSVLETEKESNFILVYGNKDIQQVIFKDKLDELAINYPSKFKIHYVYSQELIENSLFGRINNDIIDEIIKIKYKEITFDKVFICGPEEMIETVENNLLDHGYAKDIIYFELFSSTSAKKEIDKDLSGDSQITFILDEEEFNFEMRQDETILSAALQHGLDAPYSCQGGICSSCLAKVKEGKAVMKVNKILNKEEIDEGLILTCQAHPVTSKIIIDFDDV